MKLPPMIRHAWTCLPLALALLLPLRGYAQSASDGGLNDLPDASVGSGGADRDNPEGDDSTGRPGGTCRSNGDCATRFSCTQGLCRYTGIREAERVGCLLGPEDTFAVVGLGLVVAARRRREGR